MRILIVDDSVTCRAGLKKILGFDRNVVVVGEAGTGEQALELLMKTSPDLILMDILMPGIDGLITTKRVMELRPTPVLIISNVVGKSIDLNFKALQAGALDVIAKPHESQFENREMQRQFLRKIRLLSEIPVVTRRGGYVRFRENLSQTGPDQLETVKRNVRLLAIGASTGGPPALQVLLSSLDPDLPFPVLVVQHMSAGFIGGLTSWLSEVTGRKVVLANHGIRPESGVVYIAPDHCHMEYFDDSILLTKDEPPRSHCPSVDVLFESIARDRIAVNTIAVILTGMGNDGMIGLGWIKNSGGWTIAQDKESAVVFGMPQAAIANGAVNEVVPLERIGCRINSIASTASWSAAVKAAEVTDAEKGTL